MCEPNDCANTPWSLPSKWLNTLHTNRVKNYRQSPLSAAEFFAKRRHREESKENQFCVIRVKNFSEQSILLICVNFRFFPSSDYNFVILHLEWIFPKKTNDKFFLKITSSEHSFFYTFVFVMICNEKSAKSTDFASEFGKQKWWPNERSEKASISTY